VKLSILLLIALPSAVVPIRFAAAADATLDWASIQQRNEACLPFHLQSPTILEKSSHKVFAHYMPSFPLSIDNKEFSDPTEYYTHQFLNPLGEKRKHLSYGGWARSRPLPVSSSSLNIFQVNNYQREVRLALSIGIDGFSVDIGNIRQLPQVVTLLSAIRNVNNEEGAHFTVLPVIDAAGFRNDPNNQQDILKVLETLRSDPNVARLSDGRLAFSSFLANAIEIATWSSILSALQSDENGRYPAFIPIFLSLGTYNAANGSAGGFDKISYMISLWGSRTPNEAARMRPVSATLHAKGLGFMMPVAPQDFRPYSGGFNEAQNSLLFRTFWESAIQGQADWVQLVTWNDFAENTQVSPAFGTEFGFYDLAAYYIAQFKGAPASIGKDSVQLFFRNQIVGPGGPSPVPQQTLFRLFGADHGPSNLVEALVYTDSNDFKPGHPPPQLQLTVGGGTNNAAMTAFSVPSAGLASFTVPLLPGVISASLVVDGTATVKFVAPIAVKSSVLFENVLYQSSSATQQSGPVDCGYPGQANYQKVVDELYQSAVSGN
jgi:Glycosyl hydrolase family 71